MHLSTLTLATDKNMMTCFGHSHWSHKEYLRLATVVIADRVCKFSPSTVPRKRSSSWSHWPLSSKDNDTKFCTSSFQLTGAVLIAKVWPVEDGLTTEMWLLLLLLKGCWNFNEKHKHEGGLTPGPWADLDSEAWSSCMLSPKREKEREIRKGKEGRKEVCVCWGVGWGRKKCK